jgi:hypothetical protein
MADSTAKTPDEFELLEQNITHLTDTIIHGELVHQFCQFDDNAEALQKLQDELIGLIIGKFGYPDEAIMLPNP